MRYIGGGSLGILISLACCVGVIGAFAAAPGPAVLPAQVIDVGSCIPGGSFTGFRINDFAVGSYGIYAVLAQKHASPLLARIDLRGECLGVKPLPARRADRIAVDASGTIVVNDIAMESGVVRQKLVVVDGTTAAPRASFIAARQVFPFVCAAGALYGVDHRTRAVVRVRLANSRADIDPAANYNISLDPVGLYSLAAADDSSLVVFDEGPHRLTRIDLATGKTSNNTVSTPEVNDLLARTPVALRPASLDPADKAKRIFDPTVIGMGVSTTGTVYLQLNRFRPEQGPRVLALPQASSPTAFICRPPPGRVFTPASSHLGRYGSNLYLVDPMAGLIAVYDLSSVGLKGLL